MVNNAYSVNSTVCSNRVVFVRAYTFAPRKISTEQWLLQLHVFMAHSSFLIIAFEYLFTNVNFHRFCLSLLTKTTLSLTLPTPCKTLIWHFDSRCETTWLGLKNFSPGNSTPCSRKESIAKLPKSQLMHQR